MGAANVHSRVPSLKPQEMQTQREFERALKNGTLIRSSGSRIRRTNPTVFETLLKQAKANATRPVSLRLSIADIELAKSLASQRGIGYQTVLKQAIRSGLKHAG
jgi:predicted DNA binding CopG/RHH family protein